LLNWIVIQVDACTYWTNKKCRNKTKVHVRAFRQNMIDDSAPNHPRSRSENFLRSDSVLTKGEFFAPTSENF
jgi:hypothetical protein